jgi:hypothetical protein
MISSWGRMIILAMLAWSAVAGPAAPSGRPAVDCSPKPRRVRQTICNRCEPESARKLIADTLTHFQQALNAGPEVGAPNFGIRIKKDSAVYSTADHRCSWTCDYFGIEWEIVSYWFVEWNPGGEVALVFTVAMVRNTRSTLQDIDRACLLVDAQMNWLGAALNGAKVAAERTLVPAVAAADRAALPSSETHPHP